MTIEKQHRKNAKRKNRTNDFTNATAKCILYLGLFRNLFEKKSKRIAFYIFRMDFRFCDIFRVGGKNDGGGGCNEWWCDRV